jgi:serine phosphatase RsbU (regulator of sigma subunit)
VDAQAGTWERLPATRPPLGLGAADGGDAVHPWRPGRDILVLLTDGVVDAANDRGLRYGEERALAHVTRLRDQPTREMLEALFADLAAFTGGAPAGDDRTAVILRA